VSFLRAKATTALARRRHRNSVCLSVCHTRKSVKNSASYRITKSSPSAARKTSFRNRFQKLFHKFEGGHPERER